MESDKGREFDGAGEISPQQLGERVKDLRERGGITLGDLAGNSGVSRAMLSKIERGEKTPTLTVAARIAAGFGVSLPQLLGMEAEREVLVLPRQSQMEAWDSNTGLRRRQLSPPLRGGVEFTRNTLPEGATSGEFTAYPKGVEGYVAVERGRVGVVIGVEERRLEEGDALYFEADVGHRFDNTGEGECIYYLVVVGPDP